MFIISRIISYLVGQVTLEYREVIFSLLEKNPDAKLLDCGCGNGEVTLSVAERIGTSRIYGIDIVEGNIDKAKANGIQVYQGDLNQKLPFESESFDVVHASNIIEHLCNTDIFIKEVHRVLTVGGYLIISAPNLANIGNILFLILGKQPQVMNVSDEVQVGTWIILGEKRFSGTSDPIHHKRMFTLGALKELLEYHGFKVEKGIGSGFYPLPTPLAKVMCLIDKRHAACRIVKARKR